MQQTDSDVYNKPFLTPNKLMTCQENSAIIDWPISVEGVKLFCVGGLEAPITIVDRNTAMSSKNFSI